MNNTGSTLIVLPVSSVITPNLHLTNRLFSQQTSITMDSNVDASTRNDNLVENIRYQLRLLLHAHKCLQHETQAASNSVDHTIISQNPCTVKHCATMRNILQHMRKCEDFNNCSCKFDYYIKINEKKFFNFLLSSQL